MGAMLDELRRAGDPSADAVIGELARTQQIRAVSRILRHLVDNDQPVPDALPPSIARWLEQTAELPAWVNRDRFERGWTGWSSSTDRRYAWSWPQRRWCIAMPVTPE
jgi:hypothetical protein